MRYCGGPSERGREATTSGVAVCKEARGPFLEAHQWRSDVDNARVLARCNDSREKMQLSTTQSLQPAIVDLDSWNPIHNSDFVLGITGFEIGYATH